MRPQRMSNKQLRQILVPAMILLLALSVTVSLGAQANADTLETLYGRNVVRTAGGEATGAEYYAPLYSSSTESLAAAMEVSQQISDEGIVLLKNNGLLPLADTTVVSPFGLGYSIPAYSGSGSSATGSAGEHMVTPSQGLSEAFPMINRTLDGLLRSAQADTPAECSFARAIAPMDCTTESHILYELPESFYTPVLEDCRGTVGIVFISRQSGEDCDACTTVYRDGTPHMLALTSLERATIMLAKESCKAVVVVIASSAPLEIAELEDDPGIGAIVWMGNAGSTGYHSLGKVLNGEVTPSGHLPDLWAASFTADPTFPNQDNGSDDFLYTNAFTTLVTKGTWVDNARTPFREYEEGIYLGYRYYETAWDTGYLSDYSSRENGVLYPFGWGLSYTTFSQEIVNHSIQDSKISITVRVTNTGNQYSGKDAVQLYYTPPYTDYDKIIGIEKSSVNLAAFAKTELLHPGQSQDIILSFAADQMASYCAAAQNQDGTSGCYILESGSYVITLRSNSHTVLDQCEVHISSPRRYTGLQEPYGDSSKGMFSANSSAPHNRFPELTSYMTDPEISNAVVFSRSDWSHTWPTAPNDDDREASATVIQWITQSDTTKFHAAVSEYLSNEPGSLIYAAEAPVSGASNGLTLADMRGKDYSDPTWDLLLNQLSYSNWDELESCLLQAAYSTDSLAEIGKPKSVEYDGPQGFTFADISGRNWLDNVCAYPSAPVLAATWNTDLLYAYGHMVGQEALQAGINGWYAPGLNLHRSPFDGRTSEYFSQDPLLSGLLGAQVLSGAGDAGLYCAVKHFGLMQTEFHKDPHSTTWLTEQTLRELYLKPFEIALKSAHKTILYYNNGGTMTSRTMRAGDFVMAANCAIGTEWCASNYALLTQVLREEWGFRGTVISDMRISPTDAQADKLLRSGCDLLMDFSTGTNSAILDRTSATMRNRIRAAIKNICFVQANSNLMQYIPPQTTSITVIYNWQLYLTGFNLAIGLLLLAMAGFLIWRSIDEHRHPECY